MPGAAIRAGLCTHGADHLRQHGGVGALRDRHRRRLRRRSARQLRRALRSDDRRRLRDGRAAPHARVRHDERAARRDRRDDAPPRGAEPGREVPRSDHGRGRARLARDLVAAAPARLLHHLATAAARWSSPRPSARATCKKPPALVLGAGIANRHTGIGKRDILDIAARQSGKRAFERAGVKHADVDLCMIYDSFTITVLVTLENLGFCKHGEGGAFVAGRPHRARRRAAGQPRRRRPVVESPRHARHLPGHRGGQAAARRVRRRGR